MSYGKVNKTTGERIPYAGNSSGGTSDYTDLTNKPSINGTTLSGNKTTSDLGLFSGAYADLSGKPTLGTASGKDVPVSGDASISQVVMGNDTRLSDSRPASDVSAWAKASTKPSYTASEVGAIATTEKGANNGVAELDSTGKVPSSQLPSYVDDVLEYNSQSAFPTTGETGKIYIAKDTNKTYRWSGTAYVEISPSLALGETSSTAYAGNKGKANADAIAAIKDGSTIDSFSDVETALSNKVDKVSGKGLSTNDYTTTEKNKLSGIATGAEVNQNAFSNVTVGSTTIAADSKTDTLTIVAGDNITLTPDATNDKLTIAATDTKYTAATAAPGNIASSGSAGSSANYARQDHTHGISVATGDAAGQVKIAGQNASVKGFSDKQDKYTSITYAQWQALTPAQQAAKDYYISDYPSSQINAGNISYNNTTSGMAADDVQEAVDELNSSITTVENTLDTKVTFTSVGGTNANYRDVTIPSDNNAVFLIVAGGSITSVSTDSAGNVSDIVFVSISADSQKIDDHTVRIWGGSWYRSYSVLKLA